MFLLLFGILNADLEQVKHVAKRCHSWDKAAQARLDKPSIQMQEQGSRLKRALKEAKSAISLKEPSQLRAMTADQVTGLRFVYCFWNCVVLV